MHHSYSLTFSRSVKERIIAPERAESRPPDQEGIPRTSPTAH